MPRAAAKYVLAALLALFATQVVTPPARMAAPVEAVAQLDAKQRIARDVCPRPQLRLPTRRVAPVYASRIPAAPSSSVLYQRPPPVPLSSDRS